MLGIASKSIALESSRLVLPELNKIKSATLFGSYGENHEGFYLNLSSFTEIHKDYDLFIYSNQREIILKSGTLGPSLSLIADIGDVPLEDVNFYLGLSPLWTLTDSHNFRKQAVAIPNRTYVVVINNWQTSGMLVFRIEDVRGDQVRLRYAVRKYQIKKTILEPERFNYEEKNKT